MDLNYYIQMAEASPNISDQIPHFFAYRIFPPWLAGVMPGSAEFSFRILNIASLFLLVYSFYILMTEIKQSKKFALLATFFFIFNRYFFQLQAWNYFQLSDVLSNAIIFLAVIFIRRGKYFHVAFLFLLGVMTKETTLVIIPIALVAQITKVKSAQNYKSWLDVAAELLPGIILFFVLRAVIQSKGEENLIAQTVEESWKYLSIKVWLKTWIIPFIPFSFVPLIYFNEFSDFSKKNLDLITLFLIVGFTTMLGYDYERLSSPASPLIFGFTAYIIKKLHDAKKIFLKELIVIVLFVIATSFYHLWGIFKLQNSVYSLIVSLLSLLAITALFICLKLNSSSKSLA